MMTQTKMWTRDSDAGGLRHRIILSRAVEGKGASGAPTANDFARYAKVFGEVRDLTSMQTSTARSAGSLVSTTIKLRFRKDVQPNDRATWVSIPGPALTVLAGDLVTNITTVNVQNYSTSGFPTAFPYLIVVQDEVMRVLSVEGNTLTVDRGFAGTTAVGHESDLPIMVCSAYVYSIIGTRDETGLREFLLLDCEELRYAS